MKTIVIVEALSTGGNYIADIIKRGYKPIVLNPIVATEGGFFDHDRKRLITHWGNQAEFYDEKECYEETLEMIRALDPIIILPGAETGVPLANRLSADLGLASNPSKRIPYFNDKNLMQKALQEKGLRYIRGKIVGSTEEALEYYHREELKGCVVKPITGAATIGVFMCDDEEELKEALKVSFGRINIYGEVDNRILIQERINGIEYIVNTVSCNGVHRLSSVWRYEKRKVDAGGNVYDYAIARTKLQTGDSRLIRYAFDVADAIGYKNGAIHGEFMVDEKGPVLIETNCRVMGGNMKAEYMDKIFLHHETDNVLDSYLNPEWHKEMVRKPYRSIGYGAMKFFIIPKDMNVGMAPVVSLVRRLKSFHKAEIGGVLSGSLNRTIDLDTSGGIVYLAHDDEQVLLHDLEFLRMVEQRYLGMLFSEDTAMKSKKKPKYLQSLEEVIAGCNCNRSILVASNNPNLQLHAQVVSLEKLTEVQEQYDWGILDLNYREDEDIESMIEDFYTLVSKVRKGGKILVPKRSYWHLPNDMETIEILCESIDLTIEAPVVDCKDVLVITK